MLTDLSPLNIAYKYGKIFFTLTGTNLINGMKFNMDDCALGEELQGGTSTQRFFGCILLDKDFKSGSNKTVTFTDGVNGKLLGSYTVTVSNIPIAPAPQVTSVSPLISAVDQITTFTIKGKNFKNTRGDLAFYMKLENCANIKAISYSSEIAEFSCKPMQSGVIKGSASDFDFQVNVSGQTSASATTVVTSISPKTAYIHEVTTLP